MSLQTLSENAARFFMGGYLCSESVILAFTRHYGIRSSLIPKIATAFGAGFGRRGLICGCVTGALMVIGIKFGRSDNSQSYEKAFFLARKFCKTFEKKFGSLLCLELTGCNLLTDEGRKIFVDKGIKEEKCVNFVKESVSMLVDLIEGEF